MSAKCSTIWKNIWLSFVVYCYESLQVDSAVLKSPKCRRTGKGAVTVGLAKDDWELAKSG